VKQFVTTVLAAFSDYHGELQEILAEGDKVVTRTVPRTAPTTGGRRQAINSSFPRPTTSASKMERSPSAGTWWTRSRARSRLASCLLQSRPSQS
jgi:hypothetical protein